MARQEGLLKIKGTIGGMTFYRTVDGDLVREKGGVSKERIATDPAFARTRENGQEFGSAGKSGKVLRDGLRPMMLNAADNRVTSRVTQVLSRIIKLDGTSLRGSRNVAKAITGTQGAEAKSNFKNFNFNKSAILGSILYKAFTVDSSTGAVSINGLIPLNDVAYPSGATHMSLSSAYANVDFGTNVVNVEYSNKVNLPIDNATNDVVLTPAEVPAGTGVELILLKVEFFQLTNGTQYSLKNGAFNALAIIEVF